MRHLNTGIKTHSLSESKSMVEYFVSLGVNRNGIMGGGWRWYGYYVKDNNSLYCSPNKDILYKIKLFNSIEEHKAYMNKTKIISIW